MMRKRWLVLVTAAIVGLTSFTCGDVDEDDDASGTDTDDDSAGGDDDTDIDDPVERHHWFREAKYGVMTHFLVDEADERMEIFDPETLASQLDEAGAGYLIFTLGQNSGYYCSPNAAYEYYVGVEPYTRCYARDLPAELAQALAPYGIKLILYLPSRAPQRARPREIVALGDIWLPFGLGQQLPAPQIFTARWSEVIREWSDRYGQSVAGWWFDGAYNTRGWDDLSQPYNWQTWAAAARSGNPGSILAFNPGWNIEEAFTSLTPEQDYTAGEQDIWGATPASWPGPRGVQWHVLSHMGTDWGQADGPRLSAEQMIEYIRTVNEQGGIVTLDAALNRDGTIYEVHLEQLRAIKAAVRNG